MSQKKYREMTKEEEIAFVLGVRRGEIPFEEALKQYHRFIQQFIKRYEIVGLEHDDMYSILSCELYQAIETYDETKDTVFMTWLGKLITNKLGLEVKYSQRQKHGATTYAQAFRLDKPVPNNKGSDNVTYRDMLLTGDYANEQVNSNLLFNVFNKALEQENERSRYIVTEILLNERTQKDLGEELGVTQIRISQIYLKSMKEIRRKLARNGFTSALSA